MILVENRFRKRRENSYKKLNDHYIDIPKKQFIGNI